MTAHHIQTMSNTFYMYEVDWYKYEVDERSQSLHNSITCQKPTLSFHQTCHSVLREVPVE